MEPEGDITSLVNERESNNQTHWLTTQAVFCTDLTDYACNSMLSHYVEVGQVFMSVVELKMREKYLALLYWMWLVPLQSNLNLNKIFYLNL